MTFFDQFSGGSNMTADDQIDIAKKLYDHIKTCCMARKRMNSNSFEQVLAWYYMDYPTWQNIKSGFYFAAIGNPEEELPQYSNDFADCTEQNRNIILAKLKEMLRKDGFPEGAVFPITVKFRNGFRYLIKIDLKW